MPLYLTGASPVLGAPSYTGTVDEEQSPGTAVSLAAAVSATDADGDTLTYSFSGKRIAQAFDCQICEYCIK